MPCGVVWHSAARACWRCPKRLLRPVYAFMALNASTALKHNSNRARNPHGLLGPNGRHRSVNRRRRTIESGKGSIFISSVTHLTKTPHIFFDTKSPRADERALRSDCSNTFKAASDRKAAPVRSPRRQSTEFNNTSSTCKSRREPPPRVPGLAQRAHFRRPRTPEQRRCAV